KGDRDVRKPKPLDEIPSSTEPFRPRERENARPGLFTFTVWYALDAPLIWSPLLGERARVRGTAILDNLEAHPERPAALHSPTVHGENARNHFAHCTHEPTETGQRRGGIPSQRARGSTWAFHIHRLVRTTPHLGESVRVR